MDSILKALECIQTSIQTSVPSSSQTRSARFALRSIRKINDHLYEIHKPLGRPAVEFVFFHGLQSKRSEEPHLTTWVSGSKLWLEWLLEPFSEARILSVSYDASTRKTEERQMDKYLTCENLLSCLIEEGAEVGQDGCPVVLVGHSLGGLIMKQVCIYANRMLGLDPLDKPDKAIKNLLHNIKGFFFHATPHHGSRVVDSSMNFPKSPLFEILTTLNTETARSNEDFRKLRKRFGWKAVGVGENRVAAVGEFKGFVVVEEASSRHDVDTFYTIDADHFNICKPASTTSSGFRNLSNFVAGLLKEGQALEKQDQYVRRLKKRRRVLPGQLSFPLNRSPQLLAGRVGNYDLIERHGRQTRVPLPFIPDQKYYVPISNSILEIRKALEDEEGQPVVTLYGEPGLGKSSAVKYLALHYQKELTSTTTPTFPDGVNYLFCGRGAESKIDQLLQELMEDVGFGVASTTPSHNLSTIEVQRGYFQLPSVQVKLRSHLDEKKMLIILDDLWEREVFQQLLVLGARGIKYLIATQNREVWRPAEKIQLKKPSMSEARQILANYIEGLPKMGKLPYRTQDIIDAIIGKLDYLPLALANIGIRINGKRAIDASYWKATYDTMHVALDDKDTQDSPIMYGRPYNLRVDDSMMLMVESLPPGPRELLYMIALLTGEQLPEPLVRFFHRFLRSVQSKDLGLKYYKEEKYLEDRSLVELHIQEDREENYLQDRSLIELHVQEDESKEQSIMPHSLRMHYIREKKGQEVGFIASQILASSDESEEVIKGGNAEGTLVAILSAVYYRLPFRNVAANTLDKHLRIINDGVVHRNINSYLGELQSRGEDKIFHLVWLLNVWDGEPDWKKQAHVYAKKIIIKLASQGKLDDDSMARLLQLPQATSRASHALEGICRLMTYHGNKAFSRAYGATMTTLIALLDDTAASTTTRKAICRALLSVLDLESREIIVSVATKWMEILAMDSNPTVQIPLIDALTMGGNFVTRGVIEMCQFTQILEVLLGLIISSKDYLVRAYAGYTLNWFCMWKCTALKIAAIPEALPKLWSLFISEETFQNIPSTPRWCPYIRPNLNISWIAGAVLGVLSCIPENRIKWRAMQGSLEGLRDIVANIEGTWEATRREEDHTKLAKRASLAAGILAELALENELRETIASLPSLEEGLLSLQLMEISTLLTVHRGSNITYDSVNSTRALTIIYPNHSDLPPLSRIQEVLSRQGGPPSTAFSMADTYCNVYWTRVLAHIQMGAYQSALQNLYLTHYHLKQISRVDYPLVVLQYPLCTKWAVLKDARQVLREILVFLQAMLGYHADALLEEYPRDEHHPLAQRGIVKRLSRDLQGALNDLNAAHKFSFDDYHILKHRGYVKHLMGDDAGAREDAEAAQKLIREFLGNEETTEIHTLWKLEKQPINYLGYFL